MLCPACGKESSNIRVCGFCQTPFPTDDRGRVTSQRRPSRATSAVQARDEPPGSPAAARAAAANQKRMLQWAGMAIVAIVAVIYFWSGREKTIPVGVAVPNTSLEKMGKVEANSILAGAKPNAVIEEHNGELDIQVMATVFPQRRDGQLAFAQQYARADEIVTGSKRMIVFMDPTGSRFAVADPEKGVMMTR